MDYLRNMLARMRAALDSMPPSQRWSVAALAGVVVVSLFLLVTWGSRSDYVPVLGELTGAQMSSVQTALDGSDVDYRFSDHSLLVKREDKDRVLMVLTEKGALPSDISSSFGFEDIVRPNGFSLETEEQRQMKFNIALGNMLARAIASAPEISTAQVHIASSRDGYFGPERATAGVSITPAGRGEISEAKLRGICRLVAAAVGPQLPPEDVVVTNPVTGLNYSIEDQDSTYVRASDRMKLQKNWNDYYAETVREFLAPVLGRVQALVSVELDAQSTQMKETEYATVRKRTSESTETAPAAGAGDTLTQPNVGASVTRAGAGGASTSETSEKEEELAPSKEVHTNIPPGDIKDIQISVLADLERLRANIRDKDGLEESAEIATERLEEEFRHWEERLRALLVRRDEGQKVSRITFSAEPFADLDLTAASVGVSPGNGVVGTLASNWERIALGALGLIALFMVRSVARGVSSEDFRSEEQSQEEEDVELPEVEVDQQQRRAMKMRENIEEMIQSDPQAAVGLIRRWLSRSS